MIVPRELGLAALRGSATSPADVATVLNHHASALDMAWPLRRQLLPRVSQGVYGFHKSIEPIMNTILIIKAWTTGANGNAVVVLVEEGHASYTDPQRGGIDLMTGGKDVQYFYNNEKGEEWTLWLVQVNVCSLLNCDRRFMPPKGVKDIKEENEWGVAVENMIMSPFWNWQRRKNSNYLTSRLDPYAANGDTGASSQIPFNVGLSHPGAIQIPVCDIETAWRNMDKWWRDPSKAPCDYYPCCNYR